MKLQEQLRIDLTAALKAGDQKTAGVLRLLISSLHNQEIENRTKTGNLAPLTDEETIVVLQREAKKRREAMELFRSGNRSDLEARERDELPVIARYLPASMESSEVQGAVSRILKDFSGDFGAAMKAVMAELKGKADASLVSKFVSEHLKR